MFILRLFYLLINLIFIYLNFNRIQNEATKKMEF